MATLRSRLTYSNVMASIAVFISVAGGTAYAATTLITGKQIKNESITGADVKNGSLGSGEFDATALAKLKGPQGDRGLTGSTGLTGASGPAGAAGPAGTVGAKGDAGRSALTQLASGEKIVGGFDIDAEAPTVDSDFRTFIAFPIPAPAIPTVGVAPSDATCTGTVDLPTAPAGKVCVYVSAARAGSSVDAFPGRTESVGAAAARRGFILSLQVASPGDGWALGSWAYTAP